MPQTGASRVVAPGGQITTDRQADIGSAASVTQIAPAARPRVVFEQRDSAPRAAIADTASPIPAIPAEPVRQIGSAAQSRPAMPQVSRGDRSTRAEGPPSTAADRRDVRAAPVAGKDRCDPQSANAASPRCRTVIETRADSFARERPDLSPEQRLLAERDRRDDARALNGAVQRIGRNDVDAESREAQTLGAVTLAQQGRDQATVEAAERDRAAAVAAVLGIIDVQGPTAAPR